jgi:hypothetical protein
VVVNEHQQILTPSRQREQKLFSKSITMLALVAGTVIAVGGAAVAKELYGLLARPAKSARTVQIEQTLRVVAARVKATLPEKFTATTTMTDIAYKHKNMTYVYDVDARGEAPQELMETLRELVAARACVGEFKEAMRYGYAFTFRYDSPSGGRLGEFTLSAANCG